MHGYPNLHPTFVRFVNQSRGTGAVGGRYPRGTLAGPTVPAECWDTPGFKELHDQSLLDAQDAALAWSQGNDMTGGVCQPGMSQAACEQALFDRYLSSLVAVMECGPEPGGDDPLGPGLPQAGQACTSGNNIIAAQIALGVTPDGIWGPKSAKALADSGLSFEQLVPGCVPPPPSYASGGGAAVQPKDGKDGSDGLVTVTDRDKKKGMSGWWWAAIGGVAAAGVAVVVASRSEYADNPTRGPRRQSLREAIHLGFSGKSRSLARAVNYLDGLPVGGWGETRQAWRQLADELPVPSARNYTVAEFVDAAYYVDPSDRYRTRK